MVGGGFFVPRYGILFRGQNIRDTQHPEKMKSLHPPFNHMDQS